MWVPDGSPGFTVNGNAVTHSDIDESGGNVYNCLWQEGDGVSTGQHYWKVHFDKLDDGGGVGITSKDHFQEGYACKAMYYAGNLSDGSCLLVGNFGPCLNDGDTVGVLASFEDDHLKVYFDVNGKNLGLAFDVPASTFKSIFPVVRFHKSGTATCQKEANVPTIAPREGPAYMGIEGDWQIKDIQENGTSFKISDEFDCTPTTMLKKKGDDEYVWFSHVVNNISSRLYKKDGEWKASPACATLMLGPPDMMELEKKLTNLIKSIKSVEIDSNGQLSIKSDAISSTWTRFDATPGPFVGEVFTR